MFETVDYEYTGGAVQYVLKDEAMRLGLFDKGGVNTTAAIILGAKARTPSMMSALKLRSLETFDRDLYTTIDVEAIPHTVQSWPAWWATHEQGWPALGEVDVIEMATRTSGTQVAIHAAGCSAPRMSGLGAWDDYIAEAVPREYRHDCDPTDRTASGTQKNWVGCGYRTSDGTGRGAAFNAGGGGKYAYQWNASGVWVWFAPRDEAGALSDCAPPLSSRHLIFRMRFADNPKCGSEHFGAHKIILNSDFCGDWKPKGGACEGEWAAPFGNVTLENSWVIRSTSIVSSSARSSPATVATVTRPPQHQQHPRAGFVHLGQRGRL